MLLRQPDSLKDSFASRLRHTNQNLGNSFLNHETLSQTNKLIPPLIHPSKRMRVENNSSYMTSNLQYKDSVTSRQSPNNFLNRNYPFAKDCSPPNGETPADLIKKEKCNSDSPEKTPPKRSPKNSHCEETGSENVNNDRLSPQSEEKGELNSKESGSSRSGSPEEERTEIEEDRSSHDGSIASLDSFKDEWSNISDQSSPMSIGVNEAGLPICKVCGKVFKHQGSLVAHYQVHQQRTKCPVCKKVLSRHYHMKVHLLTVHKVPDSEIEGLLRSQNIA
ncbi:hypothetical protein Avbf_16154 [Armadillidium vulgare]|nr:hypothetical protein Avbf_16155 [Armadillidium vulgare]RXG55074.1 hypothetical protein Avbf_16154 [Armadillidium vulgare]